jgi:hypothetical protein
MTVIVLIGMGILLALNLTNLLSGNPKNEPFLQSNNVRGMAVTHNKIPYTLNFNQQNALIQIFNQSIKLVEIPSEKRTKPAFDNIIIYQFNDKPDLVITPITYIGQDLIYTNPEWASKGYLKEVSEGRLKEIIENSYDP